MSFFRQIRKIGDTGSFVRELSDKFNRWIAEQGIDDSGAELRLQRLDSDFMNYQEVDGPNVLNGDKIEIEAMNLQEVDGPNTTKTSKAFQYTQDENTDGGGVTQAGTYDFSDYSTDESS